MTTLLEYDPLSEYARGTGCVTAGKETYEPVLLCIPATDSMCRGKLVNVEEFSSLREEHEVVAREFSIRRDPGVYPMHMISARYPHEEVRVAYISHILFLLLTAPIEP